MMRKFHGDIKKPKAIFFDWDGTLIDSLVFLTNAHNQVRSELGISEALTKQKFKQYLGMPRDVIFEDLYPNKAEEGKEAFVLWYKENHLSDIPKIDGALELLNTIRSKNITMGVVSNKRGDFLRAEINHLGWNHYFENRIVGAGDVEEDKPSPKPLQYGIKKLPLKTAKKDIWYIGDTDIDVQCANNTQVKPILYYPELTCISEMKDRFSSNNNTLVVKKYEEICGFLLQSA